MTSSHFLDSARSGVFFLPAHDRRAAQAAAEDAGCQVFSAALRSGDKAGVLRELGHALQFPAWYGANLDALYDCLTDPEQHPPSGQVVLTSGLGSFQKSDPDGFSALFEVLSSAAEARRATHSPLWVLLDTAAPDLPAFSHP